MSGDVWYPGVFQLVKTHIGSACEAKHVSPSDETRQEELIERLLLCALEYDGDESAVMDALRVIVNASFEHTTVSRTQLRFAEVLAHWSEPLPLPSEEGWSPQLDVLRRTRLAHAAETLRMCLVSDETQKVPPEPVEDAVVPHAMRVLVPLIYVEGNDEAVVALRRACLATIGQLAAVRAARATMLTNSTILTCSRSGCHSSSRWRAPRGPRCFRCATRPTCLT